MTTEISTLEVLGKSICLDADDCQQISGYPNYFATRSGFIVSIASGTPKIIIGCRCGQMGYRAVTFPNGRRRYIHAIICEVWNGPKPTPKHQVRHLNGQIDDNASSNLAWGTAKENASDKIGHGTVNFGERNPMSKLTQSDVSEMRMLRRINKTSHNKIAQQFGVSAMTAWRAIEGKNWNG